jgi:hypothetical protein
MTGSKQNRDRASGFAQNLRRAQRSKAEQSGGEDDAPPQNLRDFCPAPLAFANPDGKLPRQEQQQR